MSGGQRVFSGGKVVLLGENTTSSCSSQNSEPLSEFSLPRTSAGPTIAPVAAGAAVGRRLDQGKASEGVKKENHADQQQFKCYGRRNRGNKQVSSLQTAAGQTEKRGEAVDDAASLDGGGGHLAIDLNQELETSLEERSESTIDFRNGSSSGGLSQGSVLSRLEAETMRSREVIPGHEALGAFTDKDDPERNAIGEQGKATKEVNEKPAGSSRQHDEDERRQTGVVVDRKASAGFLKGNEDGFPLFVSEKQDELGARWTGMNDSEVVIKGTIVPKSSSYRRIDRNDGPDEAYGSLVADSGPVHSGDAESKFRSRDHNGLEFDPSDSTRVKGILETPIRRSTTTIAKILGASRNGDNDRKRKNLGPSLISSRLHKTRAQLARDGKSRVEDASSGAFKDSGTLAFKRKDLQKRLELKRQQYEASVLTKAEDIHAKQEIFDSSKRIPMKGKEPARCKTHWDFVLEEMVWLSKDFEKERKWKLSQAKKVAARVSRSKLDVEAKGLRRIKEGEQRTRRVASNIAKDVKKFWMKVEKLVMYKHQLNLEEQRKKALDKHLDFLLGQTERYSTMLAENLADNIPSLVSKVLPSVRQEGVVLADEAEVIPLEQVIPAISSVKSGGPDVGDEDFDMDNEVEEDDDETTIAADEALVTEDEKKEELNMLQRESEVPVEELLKLYRRNGDELDEPEDSIDDDSEVSDDEESDDSDAGNEDLWDDSDKEVEGVSGKGENGTGFLQKNATASAHLSSNVANVGIVMENGRGEMNAKQSFVDRPSSHDHGAGVVPMKISLVRTYPRLELRSGEQDVLKVDSKRSTNSAGLEESASECGYQCAVEVVPVDCLLQHSEDLLDDGEYIPATPDAGSDEDDETTLEEEELLASADADDFRAEVARLKRENEVPIEELLAQYKAMAAADDDNEESEEFEVSDEDEEWFMEDRQDRTSEAETSGSSDEDVEEEESGGDAVEELLETFDRVGQPSTSGREQWSLVSSGYGRKLKKTIHRPMLLESNGNRSCGQCLNERQSSSELLGVENALCSELSTGGGQHSFLLLQFDDKMDEDTIAVVARVSEAAKRRGERVQMRTKREQQKPSIDLRLLDQDGKDQSSVGTLVKDEMGNTCPGGQDVVERAGELSLTDGKVYIDMLEVDADQSNYLTLVAQKDPAKLSEREIRNGGDEILDSEDGKTGKDKLADAAAEAQSAQPTGYTFSTTKVRTKLPFLLKHSLREYQHIGLDWLVTMYEKRLNGILADEMGLGKTIMTISLLAHLACDRGIWGPHLIVVPTSVMLNWETEFMKWCPAFKILTYFGSAKERKFKRQGWSKQNSFHVCITTYRLVIQDAKAFRRKKWKYLILDEAHLIKNWKSQRWQTLLNFNSKRRILLTGTPLQNDLMELWSLMHFLMPHVFQSHQEFRDWFSNPITGMVEGQEQINKEVVDRLHNVLRPFLLRRLKQDVEKQLPGKFEHVIRCRLSKRQRNLYEDFMANSDTQATLASGNFLGLINVLMQLRKVCNHPDLFEGRPIMSSFDMSGLDVHLSSLACSSLHSGPFSAVTLKVFNLVFSQLSFEMTAWESEELVNIHAAAPLIEELSSTGEDNWSSQFGGNESDEGQGLIEDVQATLRAKRRNEKKENICALARLSALRCQKQPLYGADLRKCVLVENPVHHVHNIKADAHRYLDFSSVIADMVQLPLTRLANVLDLVESFVFAIPAARAPPPTAWCSNPAASNALLLTIPGEVLEKVSTSMAPLRPVVVRRQLFFPDRRLLQFDCGKLQELAVLLQRLKSEGHRALIFTQMTKMLDVLEGFISLYSYTYMRLDGSTKPEQRQILMQRFNTNPKIFLFILSTRSGGVGINLVGADTVIFYDSDWNPAMDQQAQDRCHRIGQTREVHIYRLVSESTIEENILKKANQKRVLDDLVIQSGSYNTEFFKKLDPMELFSGLEGVKSGVEGRLPRILSSEPSGTVEASAHELSSAEVEAALKNAEDEADYMAMKRVEQEEEAENQEFMEEALPGNPDEEDFADEMDEGKSTVGKSQPDGGAGGILKDDIADENNKAQIAETVPQIGTALMTANAEEEMDMLADVKQMAAAAAAAGRGIMSFEDQLRPVERYAMRFLELWDPRVDRASEAAQVLFEEKEWELDQLEKLKEEQEAEIDEDNEPLLYESWDTTFANEAYRQQVEVLAQQQENQRQLEWEAMEEEMRDADRALVEASSAVDEAENFKLKCSLKKLKKAKFKYLKKGSLALDDLISGNSSRQRYGSYRDAQHDISSVPCRSPLLRKSKTPRLLLPEEFGREDYARRMKRIKSSESLEASGDDTWPEDPDLDSGDLQSRFTTPSGAQKKMREKISLMAWPLKKVPIITLEKERKRDAGKTNEHVDSWVSAEDAILCAVVHEYGGNWQLASDALAGIPDGSIYRGCYRNPFHCRERFRQLLAQHASGSSGDPSTDRNALNVATNGHLKVTEEHTKRLLEIVLQLPDNELLLQRHFGALLTAVRNMTVKGKAGTEKLIVPSGLLRSPQSRDFIPVLNSAQLPSHPPTSEESSRVQYASEVHQPVAKALKDVEVEEHRARNFDDSLLLQSGHAAEREANVEDGKFSISQFLELGPGPSILSDEVADLCSLKDKAVLVSIDDLLGLKPSPAPLPPTLLRKYAETNADHRFRIAMNSGWGVGLYEWAAAATSGLGSTGVAKVKIKKRPPPPDSRKPAKPKQPEVSKPSKKGIAQKNVPASMQMPNKKNKTVSTSSDPSVEVAKKVVSTVSGAVLSGTTEELVKQGSKEAMAERSLSQDCATVPYGAVIGKNKKESNARSYAPAAKSSKVKTAKVRKRPSSPTSALKKAATSRFSQIIAGANSEGDASELHIQNTGPLSVNPLSTYVARPLNDLNFGSDDLLLTGASSTAAVVSHVSPYSRLGGDESFLQGEGLSGASGMEEMAGTGCGSTEKFLQGTEVKCAATLPNLEFTNARGTLGDLQNSRMQLNAGTVFESNAVSNTAQTRIASTWTPPAPVSFPAGGFSKHPFHPDPCLMLSADILKRVPCFGERSASQLESWALERSLGGVSATVPVVRPNLNYYRLDSYENHKKAGTSQILLEEATKIEVPQISSFDGFELGQEHLLPISLAKRGQPKSLGRENANCSRSSHSGSSPGRGRERRSSSGG